MLFAIIVMPLALASVGVVEDLTGRVARFLETKKLAKKLQDEGEDLILKRSKVMVFKASEVENLTRHTIQAAEKRAEELAPLWPKCACGNLKSLKEVL